MNWSVAHQQVTSLPEIPEEAVNINVSNNKLTKLVLQSPMINTADASFNKINLINLNPLMNLKILNLSNNLLDEDAIANSNLHMLPLTSLNLNHNLFKEIPIQIWAMKSLQKFSIENNQLSALPSEINQLQDLQFLCIGRYLFIICIPSYF